MGVTLKPGMRQRTKTEDSDQGKLKLSKLGRDVVPTRYEQKKIEQRVNQEILRISFPEFLHVQPKINCTPITIQNKQLGREEVQRKGSKAKSRQVSSTSKEYTVVYSLPSNARRPFDRSLVIITDESGNAKRIIQSK